MSSDDSTDGPTRRRYLAFGGAIATGALAGCTGSGEDPSAEPEGTEAEPTPTDAPETPTETDVEAGDEGAYEMTMEPVGTVAFESVPETWFPYTGDYADMGVALGQADGLAAVGVKARFASHLYEELPGVSVDEESLVELWQNGTDKEAFYELDADVHVIDPNFMVNRLQWSRDEVAEIDENVGPFLGNTIFSHVYDWHDYPYYDLYEAFEKLAEVFQERERYEAFASYHDEVIADVESRLPEDRPDVAVVYPEQVPPESYYPYLIGEGTQSKHWRDLGVGDALAEHGVTDAQAGGATIDYETLLEIDPDALAVRLQGEITPEYFDEEIRSHLESHDVASELTAVQNDRVVYGGVTYQGPVVHMFQLERAAQALYPDAFGSEELFDRDRVAAIVNGEF
ncbi:ABC transporter substrate-binding protein [Haloparvum sedimenti]|uniref:ABC transporter substrate-binding protein n=1 Tax=Haloparvum sedimenti TaxID=1678448 RepID=UPI00071E6D73|nr:ABC transporter substrate-binding protein [Haloparvum sedimenti]